MSFNCNTNERGKGGTQKFKQQVHNTEWYSRDHKKLTTPMYRFGRSIQTTPTLQTSKLIHSPHSKAKPNETPTQFISFLNCEVQLSKNIVPLYIVLTIPE